MIRKRYVSLIGALGALFIFSGGAEAGLLDRLRDWAESANTKHDSRQLRFYADENCIKLFERGKLDRAREFCTAAARQNRALLYYAAVTEYRYWRYNKHWGVSSASAREYLSEAKKYLLERLEIEKGNPQAEIEIKKRLANVHLWLGEIYGEIYQNLGKNYTLEREAREIAEEYYKRAIALTEELGDNGDSYVIARAGCMLGAIYKDKAQYSYKWVMEAEAVLNKALSAIEKTQPSALFSKDSIQWTKGEIYNLLGIVQIKKINYQKADELDFKKGVEYFEKAIDIMKRVNFEGLPILKYNLARLYLAKKEYDKYVKYIEKAIELEKRKGPKSDKNDLAEWYEELGEVYLEQLKDKKRAKECFISAIELYESLMGEMKAKGDELQRIEYERKRDALFEKIKKINNES
jgi:tetratricopeptide (TPR) repeat protein